MISRINRFHGHNSLNYLFRKGKTIRSEALAIRFVHNKNNDYRLSVIVSKKVSKSAVVRNRIRRRIYEIVRIYKKSLNIDLPYDIAITVFDEKVVSMTHQKLRGQIIGLLEKAKIGKK